MADCLAGATKTNQLDFRHAECTASTFGGVELRGFAQCLSSKVCACPRSRHVPAPAPTAAQQPFNRSAAAAHAAKTAPAPPAPTCSVCERAGVGVSRCPSTFMFMRQVKCWTQPGVVFGKLPPEFASGNAGTKSRAKAYSNIPGQVCLGSVISIAAVGSMSVAVGQPVRSKTRVVRLRSSHFNSSMVSHPDRV